MDAKRPRLAPQQAGPQPDPLPPLVISDPTVPDIRQPPPSPHEEGR